MEVKKARLQAVEAVHKRLLRAHQPRCSARPSRSSWSRSRTAAPRPHAPRPDRPLQCYTAARRPRGRHRVAGHAVVRAGPPRGRADTLRPVAASTRTARTPPTVASATLDPMATQSDSSPNAPPLAPVVPTIVVILAVREGRLDVLLVQRSGPPEEDRWALPGGRWDGVEDLEAAATRVLERETGVTDLYLEQLFTADSLDSTRPSVAVAYFALVEPSTVRLREGEAWRPAWHAVDVATRPRVPQQRTSSTRPSRVSGRSLEYTNHRLRPAAGGVHLPRPARDVRGDHPEAAGPPELPEAHALDGDDRSHGRHPSRGRPPPRQALPLHLARAGLPVTPRPAIRQPTVGRAPSWRANPAAARGHRGRPRARGERAASAPRRRLPRHRASDQGHGARRGLHDKRRGLGVTQSVPRQPSH
jgi:ADP-ribose pyrophosphatase YjhB (NUDIX family)